MSNIKVPYIIKCQVTGLQKSYTAVDFVERKIANYGGDEAAMVAGYICKDAKAALKALNVKPEELTVDQVKDVITKLGGTEDAQVALDRIKSGKLFLTKKVKVRVKKEEVPAAAPVAPEVTVEAPAEPAPEAPSADIPESAPTEPASTTDAAPEAPVKKKAAKKKKKTAEVVPEAPVSPAPEAIPEVTPASEAPQA